MLDEVLCKNESPTMSSYNCNEVFTAVQQTYYYFRISLLLCMALGARIHECQPQSGLGQT